ncbi:MAG: hypothetical protein ACUVXI_10270 [bacterium]
MVAHRPGGGERKIVVMAHKDEISMLVKSIDERGLIEVENLGESLPWKYGEGPVDIIAERVFTGLSGEELEEKGVGIGTRVVVARERKTLQRLGAYILCPRR